MGAAVLGLGFEVAEASMVTLLAIFAMVTGMRAAVEDADGAIG
jgi:hypothetical protein